MSTSDITPTVVLVHGAGFVEALGRPAVLVGHSFAGAVISQTGSDARNVIR